VLDLNSLVAEQEDWANFITNVETRDTEFINWLPSLGEPVKTRKKEYQVERWAEPKINSHVDGRDWDNFKPVGEGRAELQAVIQWFDETGAISKLAEDATTIKAIAKQMAREIPRKMSDMRQDMETNWLEDHESREDNGAEGYLCRPVGKWIQATAQTHLPVDEDFLTPAASIVTEGTATVTEDHFADMFASMAVQTKKKDTITGFVGMSLKRKFSKFQFFLPSSASTQASGVNFNQDGKSRTILRAVDRYESDAAIVELHLNFWIMAITGSAIEQAWTGYFLHRAMWGMGWLQKPAVYRPEFKGGSYKFAMDQIAMMLCKNPKGEGKYAPTA
jgi:hypothetical protein